MISHPAVVDRTNAPAEVFDASVAAIEQRPDAEESQRVRVARALEAAPTEQAWLSNHDLLTLADAALAVRLTPVGDPAAAVASPYVEAWLAAADRGSLVAECRRLSDVALHNLARAQTAEAAVARVEELVDDLEGRYLPMSPAQGQAYDIAAEIRAALAQPAAATDEAGQA